jgi:type II secretory pathway component PulK
MKPRPRNTIASFGHPAGESGSLLVIVLWIAFGLVAITLYFADSMNFHYRAADNRVAALEAEEAIEGAARYVGCILSNTTTPGMMPSPQTYRCEAVSVGDASFWIIGRGNGQQNVPSKVYFGLVDESSKINLNNVTPTMLVQMLPNMPTMNATLAASIVAWCTSSSNANSSALSGGAQSTTYSSLPNPYTAKNAPFETVDELRMVYQMDMDTLVGEDANLNGALEPNENDGQALPPFDNQNGQLDPGLLDYVTVYSRLPNTTTNGALRVNVNATATTSPTGGGGGGRGGGGGGGGGGGRGGGGGGGVAVNTALTNLLTQVFGASKAASIYAQISQAGGTFTSVLQFYISSGMQASDFAQIETKITTTNSQYVTGLVNVNTASDVVLSALPQMDLAKADQLVAYRNSMASSLSNSVAWVATVLDRQTALAIGPYITGQTYQFTADIAAVGHDGRGYRRVRFVFDTSSGSPKIIHRQDLTHLGWALGKEARQAILDQKKRRR